MRLKYYIQLETCPDVSINKQQFKMSLIIICYFESWILPNQLPNLMSRHVKTITNKITSRLRTFEQQQKD